MSVEEERRRRRLDTNAADPLDDEQERLEDEAMREEDELEVSRFQALLGDKRKLGSAALVVVLGVLGIYLLLPKVIGLEGDLSDIGDPTWYWVAIAVAFNVAAFAAYVALFRGILGGINQDEIADRLDVRASYEITMAGLAATRIFSAGGAGGIALTYWALRKAGMQRRRAACRMVAFLVLMYSVYLLALVVFGVLLRTGVLPGPAPVGGTIVAAGVAGAVIAIILLVALIPQDVERRLAEFGRGYRRSMLAARLASGPATLATGVRTAIDYVAHPGRGALAVIGAVGFWAANIAVLWASFEAFGGDVPVAVLIQGFFVGMAANLIPSPAGGVGSVDAGMIGAFLLFEVGSTVVLPAVLTYRIIAFWLPIPPGIVAFFQLRRTVARWESEHTGYTSESKVITEAT